MHWPKYCPRNATLGKKKGNTINTAIAAAKKQFLTPYPARS